jgi:2'-5' RNA ligase
VSLKLFIGIEIPNEIKGYIANSIGPLKVSMKGWENPEDYHLTLMFLGETKNELLDGIMKRLNTILFQSFEVELDSFNLFFAQNFILGF